MPPGKEEEGYQGTRCSPGVSPGGSRKGFPVESGDPFILKVRESGTVSFPAAGGKGKDPPHAGRKCPKGSRAAKRLFQA